MAKTTTRRTRKPRKDEAVAVEADPMVEESIGNEAPPAPPAPAAVVVDEPVEEAELPPPAPATPAELDQETQAKYEEVKRGELHITDLQKMTVAELHEIAKNEGHRGVHRPEEAGPDLQDPQGAHPEERADVRRGRAGDPAGRLRLPAQPGLQLPAQPGRHLRLAQPDPALRPAAGQHRRRADPPAQGVGAVLRPAAGGGDQLRGPRPADREGQLRGPHARCTPTSGSSWRPRPKRSTCAWWTWSRRSASASAC